jgi:transcriptional regulator of acetoin/glycerol metabolism
MTDPADVDQALMNHLAIVLGFSQLLLQEATLDDPRRGDLAEIHKAATAAVQIVSARVANGPADGTTSVSAKEPEGLEAVERAHIVRVLADVQGNKLAAARRLGISRRTLYRRLERHGLR